MQELAFRTIDMALAQQICECTSFKALAELEPDPSKIGTWMVWQVHRVYLNDPTLTELNFRNRCMPDAEAEPRIAPKLMQSLARNTHLQKLLISCANLHGGELAVDLGASLARNSTLRRLDMESNHLTPEDLQAVFRGLGSNFALQELRCSNQFCEQAGRDTLAVLHESLKTNRKLEKLGMDLVDRHYRDQIVKALIRNTEEGRRFRDAETRRQQAITSGGA